MPQVVLIKCVLLIEFDKLSEFMHKLRLKASLYHIWYRKQCNEAINECINTS